MPMIALLIAAVILTGAAIYAHRAMDSPDPPEAEIAMQVRSWCAILAVACLIGVGAVAFMGGPSK